MDGEVCTNLIPVFSLKVFPSDKIEISLLQGVDKHKLRNNYCRSLETDCLPTLIAKVLYFHHSTVGILGKLRQEALEVRKERRIVKGPFGGILGTTCQLFVYCREWLELCRPHNTTFAEATNR